MASRTTLLLDRTRCSAFTVMAALVLLVTVASRLPAGARASALRPVSAAAADDHDGSVQYARHRRDVGPVTFDAAKTAVAAVAATGADTPATVRDKRSFKLLKLKPLIVLPAKVALGAGSKLVAGAKLGAKAVGVGAKAVGAGLVGLKALSKVAKVTVKAATALGIKAVLLNFLFHKINQVIDFKTRLLSNLDQKNRQQNALFLSGVLPQPASKPVSAGSVGNKDPFVPEQPPNGFAGPIVDPPASFAPGSVELTPGSNLVASSPPAPPSQQSFGPPPSLEQIFGPPPPPSSPPQSFGPQPASQPQQGFGPSSTGFSASLEPVNSGRPLGFGQQGYVTSFAASNDDGTHSSETTF